MKTPEEFAAAMPLADWDTRNEKQLIADAIRERDAEWMHVPATPEITRELLAAKDARIAELERERDDSRRIADEIRDAVELRFVGINETISILKERIAAKDKALTTLCAIPIFDDDKDSTVVATYLVKYEKHFITVSDVREARKAVAL